MVYCEGKACQKRHECVFHHPEKHPEAAKHNILQYIDRSLTGACGASSNGECWTTWDCGDNGHYALFEPILEDDDYRGVLEAKLDEWGVSLYHRDGSEKSMYELLYDIINEIEPLIQRIINENQ